MAWILHSNHALSDSRLHGAEVPLGEARLNRDRKSGRPMSGEVCLAELELRIPCYAAENLARCSRPSSVVTYRWLGLRGVSGNVGASHPVASNRRR